MALTKTINIDGKDVTFKASAAIPRIYRIKFGRDIYKDLSKLEKSIEDTENDMDMFSLEMFEDLAWVMAKHANPKIADTPDEWLEEFNTFSIYQVLPELIELWGLNTATDIDAKENFKKAAGK